MFNFNKVIKEKKEKYNPEGLYIPDQPYTVLIIGGSG